MSFTKALALLCLAMSGIAQAANIGFFANGVVYGTAYNRDARQLTGCNYGSNRPSMSRN